MRGYFILIFLLLPLYLQSQQYIDLARFSYMATPSNDFETRAGGSAISEWQLQLNFPIPLNDRTTLLTGFTANDNRLRLDPLLPDPENLKAFSLDLGINQRFSDSWAGTYLVIPKFASDAGNTLEKGFQLGLVTLFTKTFTEKKTYSFGMYSNTEEYGLLLVPLLGAYFQSADTRLEANLLLPIRADVHYGLNVKTRIGLIFDGLGTSYAIDNPVYRNAYVNKSSNELFAYLEYGISPSLLLRLKSGYAFFRAYKVYDANDKIGLSVASVFFGDNRTILNSAIKDGFLFKAEIVYRFHFQENKQ